MTTNLNIVDGRFPVADGAFQPPPGVPGVEELLRLANQLFRENTRGGAESAMAPNPQIPEAFSASDPGQAISYYFLKYSGQTPHPPVHAPGDDRTIPMFVERPAFDLNRVREDFPVLSQVINGHRLAWLDNAATTQKPRQVIDRIQKFYEHENSNIHRGAHTLATRATDAYEGAREKVRGFLGASSTEEIVFVRGATEAINLVAQTWGQIHVGKGDEIIISHLEHHANIVPWQQLRDRTGAVLKIIPVDGDGQIQLDAFSALLGPRTRLVSITHVSNALGTITPVKKVIEMAHAVGAKVLVDGAQAVSHMPVNVQALGADWYVFSGHKVFGPTGIGVLYGTKEVLAAAPPWQGGGNMIADVTFEETRFQPAPAKFEAGTGNIADAVGLGSAIDYITTLGLANIASYEHNLLNYGMRLLRTVPGLRLIGTAAEKASVLSFVMEGYSPVEISTALDRQGIAVRAGHHCAQPILRRFGLEATVRPSLAFYNTCSDIDRLVAVLHSLRARKNQF